TFIIALVGIAGAGALLQIALRTAIEAGTTFQTAHSLTLLLVGTFALLMGIILVVLLVLLDRYIMRPIKALTEAVTRITLGDLSQTVPVYSHDEIGALGANFNEMTDQLAATHRSLQEATRVASEGRAQLESSINGLRQGFILTNAKAKPVLVNAAAREMLATHAHKGTLRAEDIADVLPKELQLTSRIEETLQKGTQAKFPSLALGGRFFNVYLSPVLNEKEIIGCAMLLEDVTEERIMQRSRDEFFSIASHELRTPLTAIMGNTALIRQYFPEAVKDPSVKEMVDDIHGSATRLIEIVNDFLDASRLEQDKMKFEFDIFTVEPVIEKVIYELSGLSRQKGITLSFDQNTLGKLPPVYADQNRVKQILYNLIGNGMKFTVKGGVSVNCLVEGPELKITITDTGPGISLEGQQILFHKFQQSTASILTRDNTRGTGLGLYISKLLIEHMHGTIKLEHTEVGKGSTFSFTLPLAKKTDKPAPPVIVSMKEPPSKAKKA
ncbi:MAG TPA: ATP-binding protein, partial [Candidatus Saccharimonadia bacterium]|nr:ATP-binding protein [Candidatus Saccharimonadia bacterium]